MNCIAAVHCGSSSDGYIYACICAFWTLAVSDIFDFLRCWILRKCLEIRKKEISCLFKISVVYFQKTHCFALLKVVRQHFIGEVSTFVRISYTKIIKISWFFAELLKIKGGVLRSVAALTMKLRVLFFHSRYSRPLVHLSLTRAPSPPQTTTHTSQKNSALNKTRNFRC